MRRPIAFALLLLVAGAGAPACVASAEATAPETTVPAAEPDAPAAEPDAPATEPDAPATQSAVAAAAPPAPTAGAPRWSPPEAQPAQWEWLLLTSGEWLKGELHELRQEQVDFESDELDDLTLDWEDVAEFRSPRIRTFGFTAQRAATGIGRVVGGEVIVLTALGEERYPRAELLSIVPGGGQSEWRLWSGKLSVGLTARAGNTNQVDAQLLARLRRRTAFNRVSLDYIGNYSESAKVKTASNQDFDARFDRFLYEHFYVTPATIEVYVDEFQNIDYRISPGAGFGYEIVDNKWLNWTVGLDGVYRRTRFLSVQAGGSDLAQDGAAIASTSWEIDITSRVDLDGKYSVAIGIPEPAATNQHGEVILSIEVTKILDVDVTFVWDRVGRPEPDASGAVPLQDDFKLAVGLGLDW